MPRRSLFALLALIHLLSVNDPIGRRGDAQSNLVIEVHRKIPKRSFPLV